VVSPGSGRVAVWLSLPHTASEGTLAGLQVLTEKGSGDWSSQGQLPLRGEEGGWRRLGKEITSLTKPRLQLVTEGGTVLCTCDLTLK
jgi:hypothetical protein